MHTVGPPANHWEPSMLLPAALTWMMQEVLTGHPDVLLQPLLPCGYLGAETLQLTLSNGSERTSLSFRFQNNFILQIRKLRLKALELLTWGYMAGLGLGFVMTKNNF